MCIHETTGLSFEYNFAVDIKRRTIYWTTEEKDEYPYFAGLERKRSRSLVLIEEVGSTDEVVLDIAVKYNTDCDLRCNDMQIHQL